MQSSVEPSLHDLLEKTPGENTDTTREYSHKIQRKRLWRLTIGEWINTLVLCVAYFGILYAYAQKNTIDVPQRREFNAITTGISLLLGVNLAASLRSYAKLMRWRMLAMCYRPLETFDLVMGCDSLLSVFNLVRKARNPRHRFLPSKTQILCVLWLLVHLAITILVGIIGLNYNLDDSADYVLTKTGDVSIVDLNSLSTYDSLQEFSAVQTWGVRGMLSTALDLDASVESTDSYFSDLNGYTLYYFQDANPNDSSQAGVTTRYIESQAYCNAYTVTEGQYGNLTYLVYKDGDREVNRSLPVTAGSSGLIALASLNSTCGPRCADLWMFQARSLPGDIYSVDEALFFVCNNTVGQVADDLATNLSSAYLVSDLTAFMLAGAVGWNDVPPVDGGQDEYELYANNSMFGFGETPTTADMADLLSSFTMGAVAFMDGASTMTRKDVADGREPIVAQVLKVKWKFAGTILAIIPFIHFCTLVMVIMWANKVIIKDDSHLAIAKVYNRLLAPMGDRGCLLRGEEIVDALHNPHVAYGWRKSSGDEGILHVDVFEQYPDMPRGDGPFVEGLYNGEGDGDGRETRSAPFETGLGQRRRYRDIDAAEYF